MPLIDVKGRCGPWKCCYEISTPTEISAEKVDTNIPVVVFIHSLLCGKETFERQFDNPTLRQFNLVTFDLRAFGETGGAIPKKPWLPTDVTDDVHDILEALKLPPCHFFGLSLGSYVAVDLAAKYPHKVLSVMACSPLSAVEPEDIAEGRRQLFDSFEHYARPKTMAGAPTDEGYADDFILGSIQLMFNVIHTPLVHANLRLSWEYDVQNYTNKDDDINTLYEAQVGVFLNRKAFAKDHLKKIQCPIAVIHCTDDVAYTSEAADDLRQRLAEAGVQVSLTEVPGPHFACVTHPEEINSIIYETISSSLPKDAGRFEFRDGGIRMETPFRGLLAKHGYHVHHHHTHGYHVDHHHIPDFDADSEGSETDSETDSD